ncbi:MAG: DUF1735 and LamG domain-containing protein [Chitinophagaceae bacterium]
MRKSTYLLPVLLLVAGLFGGCRKGVDYKPALFFTGTELSPETKFTIDGPSSIGVSVTSSVKVDRDITVNLEVKPELVEAYNEEKGTAYEFLPQGSYELEGTSVVIKNGFSVSDPVKFSVLSLNDFEEGVTYCVPITITNTDGDIPVLEASRTVYLIIKRTIITRAAVLSPNYFSVPSFQTTTSLASIPKLTLECRILVNQFTTANPFISSVIGIEENFLLRFGDVSIANNQMQLAGGLINTKKFPVTSKATFSTGQWYHVAVVYDGARISLYVNGVLDNYTDAEPGGINLTDSYSGGFQIGFSAGGRKLNGAISEARVWTRALSATELQNNLCYVDPASNGLVAYWRFNDATGNNVTDLTGHGHTAVGLNPVSWITGVRCP